MKIIFYRWHTINEQIVSEYLHSMGHEVAEDCTPCKDYVCDKDVIKSIVFKVNSYNADAIFSVNFFPVIASIAEALNIKYYSISFDSPSWTMYSHQIKFSTNRTFCFDKAFVNDLSEAGVTNIFHSALAGDPKMRKIAINNKNMKLHMRYTRDIAFVGTLYKEDLSKFRKETSQDVKGKPLIDDKRIRDEINRLVEKKAFRIYEESLFDGITQEQIDYLCENNYLRLGEFFFAKDRDLAVLSGLAKKITVYERNKVVEYLADKYRFGLYTNSDISNYSAAVQSSNCGPVDYRTQMPLVFNYSKININHTARGIRTGLPQRVFDVCASGGFLLSNAQEELGEFFHIGTELDTYNSLEEMGEKIDFYLAHDELRKKIADAGYERICKDYTYEKMLNKVLSS